MVIGLGIDEPKEIMECFLCDSMVTTFDEYTYTVTQYGKLPVHSECLENQLNEVCPVCSARLSLRESHVMNCSELDEGGGV